jgi:acyl-coenzyme A thioesterase PaaI-like protein
MTAPDSSASRETRFSAIRAEAHPFCVVCGQSNPFGLGLKFNCETDGSVTATFLGHPALEGFQGFLHGGMIASLLEGAMTNCLFAHNCVAMTGELNVHYQESVVIGEEMRIRGWVERSSPPLHWLAAELKQGDRVKAAATGKFRERA